MPKIRNIGLGERALKVLCFSKEEADRLPNICLGQRIMTNGLLKKTPELNQYINKETMGALDNYAKHEDMRIFITPLENDVFDKLRVAVFKEGQNGKSFAMNISGGKEGVPIFFRELYNKVHKCIHSSEK